MTPYYRTQQSETKSTETLEESANSTDQSLRWRTFLGGIATAGATPTMQVGSNQTGSGGAVETQFELGAVIEGWQRSPKRYTRRWMFAHNVTGVRFIENDVSDGVRSKNAAGSGPPLVSHIRMNTSETERKAVYEK